MSTVHAEIEINAPIEVVWETIMNPTKLGDWVTIHRSVDNVSELPLRRGATMDQHIHVRGITFKVHWTLISLRAPYRAEWEGAGPAHSTAIIKYELAGDGNGGTTFKYTNEFHPPGGKLGNMAGKIIVGTTSEHEAHDSLWRLKALLERN
jgi:uncharacterized membrane protein